MKKKLIVLTPLLISIGCLLTFSLIGSRISEDGTLVEPFFLIPVGWFFFAIALISSLVLGALRIFKHNPQNGQ